IYEEGNLIKRSIRDLYSREIEEVLVEGEQGYRVAKDFMKMIMPSHAKNVKHYTDAMPLFARYQVETYLGGMFNPSVQLKSGGYIVIGVTEALVAIDVNSGRATKEGSIEETALKTNLEAADEVARQLRLRDLAGLIVIDFIDMDERKNHAAVEKRLKDKLKSDRARIQVGRISGFGLLEMSRQRLRPGMLEASTQPCPACHGTGLIRSDDSMALSILRQIEEEGTRGRSREVLVRCPVGIANFLINAKREHIAQIEARYGMAVRVEGDPALVSPDFTLEKFKTATRSVAAVESPVISADAAMMDDLDEAEDETPDETTEQAEKPETPEKAEASDEDTKPKRRRRRRRRRKSSGGDSSQSDDNGNGAEVKQDAGGQDAATQDDAPDTSGAEEKPAKSRKPAKPKEDAEAAEADSDAETASAPEKPEKRKRAPRKPRSAPKTAEAASADMTAAEPVAEAADTVAEPETTAQVVPPQEVEPSERPADEPAAPDAPAPAEAARDREDTPDKAVDDAEA
ncbi:MAG TPA: ribonuclease E/G, partial [Hyphomicrobiales bacterium]|nr:ribonuclease E/G [Hyphomicrobiales bacterium]